MTEFPKGRESLQSHGDLFDVLDAFDQAWREESPPQISAFLAAASQGGLAADAESRRHLLTNLAHIDLECRWRHWKKSPDGQEQPKIEIYPQQFPELLPADVVELVLEDYRIRMLYGLQPSHVSCYQRFPVHADALAVRLPEIDRELAMDADRPLGKASGSSNGDPARNVREGVDDLGVDFAIPGFEPLGLLGRGGMGVVYRARQLSLNRTVAIKMIQAGQYADPAERALFQKEAKTIAELKHPHIVEVHDFNEHGGTPYLVLEFVDGGSLASRLEGRAFPSHEAIRIMLALTGAVQYAHERGVIHRDIKPANILTMQDGWIKLSDFGLAKHLTPESMSASGNVVGTPAYMAPEQAEGRSADIGPATDVYALGVVFYEMLTGRPPFQGSSALAIMRDLCSVPPPLPSELDPTIDAELERICLRCLEKSPSRRFPSAAALGQDLRSFEAENATQCRSGQPARRHVRRRLLMGATVAAVILLGTLVLARVSGFLRLPQRDANAPMASAPLPEGALRIAAGDDLDQIIDQCTQQVHMHPDDAEAYLRRAVATYYKTLHEPDVIADCSKALELHPNLAAAFAFRAGARTDLGQLEAALQDCNSSLASDATCSYAYAFRALAKVNANELDAALADCVDALRLDPNLALAYNHRGIALLRLGEYRQAIAAFSEAIRLQPQFVWPYHHRAMCHLNTRQYDECIADETQALRLSPTWYRSFQNRGRAFLEKGDFAAAVRDLTEATRLDPTDAFTWKIRGDTHRAKGDLASARNSYRTARKIDPQITVPEFDVAAMVLQAENAFERDDLDAAERGFRDVLVLEPKHAQAHDRLGWIFLERHDRKSEKAFLESALLHFNQAINNAPAYSSAFHGRARTRWELKQPKEAIEDISSAIRCAPKEPMLFRERGDRYLETGDRARALDDYASMIAIEPKNPDHYEYRAGILKDIGQSVAAEKDIAKAKELRKTPK